MSDVVLRCPNCGTTQTSRGECDACHEAEVRFFCPNHDPGRWLDGPLCAECAVREKRERTARPTPPRRNDPPLEAPVETPRHAPARTPRFEDAWAEPRDRAELDPITELEATISRYMEGASKVRVSPAPLFGCIGQLLKVAIIIAIILAMATCWFLNGGIVITSRWELGPRYGQREMPPSPWGVSALSPTGPGIS